MDKSVLVTGAAGRIGSEIVRVLRRRGWNVIAADVSEQALVPLCSATGAEPLAIDVTLESHVCAIQDLRLDAAVNCAGYGATIAAPTEVDAEVFERAIAVNTWGTLLVIKYAAQGMIARGVGGSIVNISSQASLVALPGHTAYAASKAAVDSITRTSARDLGEYGIRVNSVNPTVVMTPMAAPYWGRPEVQVPFLAAMPLGRWATERDVAGPVAFLLSDDASMITGVSLPVDGGFTIQ